jgi:hypothetical protein
MVVRVVVATTTAEGCRTLESSGKKVAKVVSVVNGIELSVKLIAGTVGNELELV